MLNRVANYFFPERGNCSYLAQENNLIDFILASKYIGCCMDLKEFSSMGGKARAAKLSPERRKEIASKAIHKRWNKPFMPASIQTDLPLKPGCIFLQKGMNQCRNRIFMENLCKFHHPNSPLYTGK